MSESAETQAPAPEICFIISEIGAEDSAERKHADEVYDNIIAPEVEACGYKPHRVDRSPRPTLIDHEIIEHLLEAPMAVAYLANNNPNVFYELGIRHAFGKPVVLLLHHEQRLPFDIRQSRAITLNMTDVPNAMRAKKELGCQLAAAREGADTYNPVSAPASLLALTKSDEPIEKRFADLAARVEAGTSTILDHFAIIERSLEPVGRTLRRPPSLRLPRDQLEQLRDAVFHGLSSEVYAALSPREREELERERRSLEEHVHRPGPETIERQLKEEEERKKRQEHRG